MVDKEMQQKITQIKAELTSNAQHNQKINEEKLKLETALSLNNEEYLQL